MQTTRESRRTDVPIWEQDFADDWDDGYDGEEPAGGWRSATRFSLNSALHDGWQSVQGMGWLLRLAALVIIGVLLLQLVVLLVDRVRIGFDDWRYGRPRMSQLTAFVGHGEADGSPTTLIALNLNRRIVVVEIPGGDQNKMRTINGPVLVGHDEDLTLATMRLQDVNGDSHPDLLVRIKSEELVFINDRGEFRLMTRAERAVVERTLGGGQ